MSLITTVQPVREPVSLQELRDWARVDLTDDDALLDALIKNARQAAENFLWRRLITQTVEYRLDRFPSVIRVPIAPVQAVASISYNDGAGAAQTLAGSGYTVDSKSEPCRIVPAYQQTWPDTLGHLNDVTVTLTAGYGADAETVPEPIRTAILILAATWYEHREAVMFGATPSVVPLSAEHLLRPHRLQGV